MKKMIMFLSFMVMACSLHAASAMWGFGSSDIQDSTGSYIDGGTAFLFLGTVTASESEFNIGTATQLATAGQDPDMYTFGDVNTPVNLTGLANDAAGQVYTLILLEGTGASLAGYEGNYILVNGTSDRGADPMSGDTWAIMTAETAFQASDWQTMEAGSGGGTPEPTSGLLLLIGGSLLALRRKHA